MTRAVRFRAVAALELADAIAWYEQEQPGTGIRLVESVDRAVDRIAQHPFAFPEVRSQVRRAITDDFPYLILYRVDDDGIDVFAVMHASRDPRRWESRLE